MKTYFATLARYNAWATRKLFEHIGALPEADYRRDAGLFFKSVHGTLNHLLVAEQFPPHGKDGHSLFTRFPDVGRPTVAEFLRQRGFEMKDTP